MIENSIKQALNIKGAYSDIDMYKCIKRSLTIMENKCLGDCIIEYMYIYSINIYYPTICPSKYLFNLPKYHE